MKHIFDYMDVAKSEFENAPLKEENWDRMVAEDDDYTVADMYAENAGIQLGRPSDSVYGDMYNYVDENGEERLVLVREAQEDTPKTYKVLLEEFDMDGTAGKTPEYDEMFETLDEAKEFYDKIDPEKYYDMMCEADRKSHFWEKSLCACEENEYGFVEITDYIETESFGK